MNFLDTKTILVSDTLSAIVCAWAMVSLWLRHRQRTPALILWPAGNVLHLLGVLLVVLRGRIPDDVSVVGGVPLFLGGMLLLVEGTSRYLGGKNRAVRLGINGAWLTLLVIIHAWFALAHPSLQARNINLSAGVVLFMGQGAWLLLRGVPDALRPATRPAGLVFAAFVLVSGLRICAEVAVPPGEDFFKSGLYDNLALLTTEMLFIALTFLLILMVNHGLLADLEADIDQRRQAEDALRVARDQLELRVDERTRELTRSSASLRESEEKFRLMAASARDAILMADEDGRLTFWNKAAEEMFGCPPGEAIGQKLHALLAPVRYHDTYRQGYRRFRETGQDPVIGTLQTLHARRKDGAEFPVEVTVAPLQLAGRWHALGIMRDITLRRQAEVALRQAKDDLERRVRERTAELVMANSELQAAQTQATRLLAQARESRRTLLSLVEDQKAAEAKLRESEERLQRAVLDSPFPILLHAEDGQILLASNSWCEITGYSRAELQTIEDWTERAFGERKKLVQAEIDALYRLEHRKYEGDYAVQIKDGTTRIWEFSSAPLGRLPDGRRLVMSMALDVTERRRLEEDRQKFFLLAESSSEFIGMCDLEMQPLYVNPAGQRMVGLPDMAAACRVKVPNYFFPEDQAFIANEFFPRVLREGHGDVEIRLRHFQTGEPLWFQYYLFSVQDAGGKAIGWATVSRDITERRKAEAEIRQLNAELEQRVVERTAQLEAANKELEAFSYSVSHDLRAPLRAVDGFANILVEDYARQLDAEGQRVIGVMRAEAQRMGELIDDLLAFSRLGRQPVQLTQVDLNALAQAVYEKCAAQEPDRRIEFKLHPLPSVRADAAMLRQVLANLLSNAVKFTRPREAAAIEIGVIESPRDEVAGTAQDAAVPQSEQFSIPPLQSSIVFFVRDNGVGFDMKYVEKLFGVFQRLHTMEEFEGTGVGLALVQRVIRRHGGRVWAEGKVNGGATFYFSLPRGISNQ